MNKYQTFLLNRISVGIAYRTNLYAIFLLDVISVSSTVLLWLVVFASGNGNHALSVDVFLLYFFINPIVGLFTVVYLADYIEVEIREGALSGLLLKPYHKAVELFTRTLASKLVFFVTTGPIYIAILIGVSIVLHTNPFSFTQLLLAIPFLIAGFLTHFFLELCAGWMAFWIDDVWALRHFKTVAIMIFGGTLYPLEFTTNWLRVVYEWSPFQFFFYIPNAYLIGLRDADTMLLDSAKLLGWMVFFLVLSYLLWKKGLERYGAFGN